ncbi:MAG: ATP-binding protein [Ignavibacteriales bacterium]|jgi:anti-sigma regulatory factor (Ser/Thr protein kinase)|nr:ATP-binding protein [Ignavibacteriales bacterium]MCE7857760.1 hypothetical protein [Ignavibacteria bacterium CHB3]
MLDAKIVKESFDPKLITALFKNFSNQYIALFELIDNAVDDRQQNEKLIISIDYDPDDEKLFIKNFNGKGMSIEDLEKFFTWGHSEKTTGRIGRYGQGGKAALGYLAKSFNIKSHSKNKISGFLVKVKDWENRQTGFTDGFQVVPYQSQRDEGDVSFEIFNLKKEFRVETIIERIKKTYRPLITQKKVEFLVENMPVKCLPIAYDKNTYKTFNTDFTYNGRNFVLNGEFGIVDDPKSERGGFKIFQYGRNVADKEYFGHTDPSKRWNVERLYGELYIEFDLPLSMNKTEIDKDSELWRLIERTMNKQIAEIIKEAVDYKTPTRNESKAVDSINKKLKKSDDKKDIKIELTNYGSRLLFKIEKGKNGENIIKINRDHKAYKLWSSTELGKKYYTIIIYALTETTKNMTNKEAAKFLNEFSEHFGKKSNDILG